MDERGAMFAAVQAGKAGDQVTQVQVDPRSPRLALARNWKVTSSIMVGMALPIQCE